jgi:hypothetical protein
MRGGGKKGYMVSEGKEGTSGTGGKEGYQKELREPVMRSISGIPNGQERVDEKDSDRVPVMIK